MALTTAALLWGGVAMADALAGNIIPHPAQGRVVPTEPQMRGAILRVAKVMPPVASLPDAPLLPCRMACPQRPLRQSGGKPRLDQPPAQGMVAIAIAIAFGQGPDRMQMVRQHHPGIGRKRSLCLREMDGMAQPVDLAQQQIATANPSAAAPMPARLP